MTNLRVYAIIGVDPESLYKGGKILKQPANVFGITDYYSNGEIEYTESGFGYKNKDNDIIWYDGYDCPPDDEFHLSFVYSIKEKS